MQYSNMFVSGILDVDRKLEHTVCQMSPMNGAEASIFTRVSGFPHNNRLYGHPDSIRNCHYVSIATLFISFMEIYNIKSNDGHDYIIIGLGFWSIFEGQPAVLIS